MLAILAIVCGVIGSSLACQPVTKCYEGTSYPTDPFLSSIYAVPSAPDIKEVSLPGNAAAKCWSVLCVKHFANLVPPQSQQIKFHGIVAAQGEGDFFCLKNIQADVMRITNLTTCHLCQECTMDLCNSPAASVLAALTSLIIAPFL